ncbi:MAG: hypothetical protein QOH58_498 [Thermoleophilaceae bacterium]|jgi:hypothetical protein|nr:hypothetical protein [Thermoleophilaceae bacterium]
MEFPHVIFPRSRFGLATVVALACALAALGIASIPGEAAEPVVEQPSAPPAHAHSGDLGVPGTSEQQLLELETATLGPAHAAEHAMLRRAMSEDEPAPRVSALDAAALDEPLDPAQVGRWDSAATVTLPIVAIHAAMLPTGKVMVFSFPQSPRQNSAQAWLWDPATGQKVRKDPPLWLDPKDGQMKAANIWCSGHTFTADGELVVFGGNLEFEGPDTSWKGLNKIYTFDPFTETWREQPDMRHGRWYPTGVRLADGRIPITSGLDESGVPLMNEEVEMFTPPAAPGGLGTTSLIGNTSYSNPALPPSGETYPHMFAMPSGRALVVGPEKTQTWFMNTPGANSFTWTKAPNMIQRRLWGTAVPVPGEPNKIMALGGTSYSLIPSTNTTEVFDEANPAQGWQPASSTVIGRGHANTVLLPDGSMVEVGGGVGRDDLTPSPQHAANPEQRQIELWDPQTREWRLGPAQAEGRAYHSTALLLPDGRVMSAGDEYHGGLAGDTAEIYEPPYLHRGPRPTIASAPASIKLGADFGVTTPDTNLTRAALVAPGSATHAVDMNQRFIPLTLTRRSGCVDISAPSNANAAPPGYYMLFLLNDQGVPSVAKFVRLRADGAAPAACNAPPPPPDQTLPTVGVTAPAGGATVLGSVDVTASASDNVGVTSVQFRLDGQNLGPADTTSPYSTTWQTTEVANGPHELRAVARDAAGNTRTSAAVTVTVKNADKTPPTVALTAPSNGATVSETINVTASASDDEAVAGVQFKLDGENLGLEDTSAPYSVPWATRNSSNANHELTAVARDAADNTKTSAKVTVAVKNAPAPVEPPAIETPPAKVDPPTAGPPPTTPVAPSNAAPAISRLKLSGTRISFRLSEAATVKLSFERKGSRRYTRLKTKLTLRGKAGANSAYFNARRRGLRAARYRLTALATDSAGKRSALARTSFRVARPARASLAGLSLVPTLS